MIYSEKSSDSLRHYSVAVIGAGPFGLALAARLRAANINFALFGRLMSFWQENVPIGTRLMSGPVICSLSDNKFDCAAYAQAEGIALPPAFSSEEFIAYTLWFQRQACPDPDPRTVVYATRDHRTYKLQLSDGTAVTADNVAIAIGLKPFAFRPRQFANIPGYLVLHTSDLHDLSEFRGRKLAIIGSGQSAIDCAALLSEGDAEVEVLARARQVQWSGSQPAERLAAPSVISKVKGSIRGFLAEPEMYRCLPVPVRQAGLNRMLRPMADRRMIPRLSRVRFGLGRTVTEAFNGHNQVLLHLDDHSVRMVDRVVLGTGYRMDVDEISFLSAELRQEIQRHGGYPKLNSKMESSAPGLYFIGALAAWSFGPLMWLVKGAPWAASTVSRAILARHASSARAGGQSSIQRPAGDHRCFTVRNIPLLRNMV
jgi:thioredoxin reductase